MNFTCEKKIIEIGRSMPFLKNGKTIKGLCNFSDSSYKSEIQDLENSPDFCDYVINICTE
jgi:hypothetical protein